MREAECKEKQKSAPLIKFISLGSLCWIYWDMEALGKMHCCCRALADRREKMGKMYCSCLDLHMLNMGSNYPKKKQVSFQPNFNFNYTFHNFKNDPQVQCRWNLKKEKKPQIKKKNGISEMVWSWSLCRMLVVTYLAESHLYNVFKWFNNVKLLWRFNKCTSTG